ncbi:MAG: UbiA family prenyltransferase [Chitinophagaceae bacterium]|nr:UbiA family prenyltransferase [Chitinophagaceae bacterium]
MSALLDKFVFRLNTLLHFVLFTSVFSSLCTLVLCIATEKLILGHLPPLFSSLHLFIIGSTLVVYNVHYLIKKSSIAISDQYAWVQQHRLWNYFFLGLGFVLCGIFAFAMPKAVWQAGIVLSVFSFAYSVPILPFKNKYRLKDIGWLKIIILACVWVAVTAVLPMLFWSVNPLAYPYEIGLRFLLLFILCLAFDIRDMQVDFEAGIYTLPNKFGVVNTYRLINMLAFVFFAFALAQLLHRSLWDRFLLNIVTIIATLWGIHYVRKHPSDKNYQLFVDGQMLLNGFLLCLL